MLEQIDALPGAERRATVHHGDRKQRLGERGADMRGHVVGAFHRVPVARVAFGRDAFEEVAEVGDDVGVGVFLNRERGGSVLAEERQESGGDVALGDPVGDGRGEVVEALSGGGDFEAGGELFHVYA